MFPSHLFNSNRALPVGVCNSIDKLLRTFLWYGTKEKQKVQTINWSIVTRSKNKGGLGIKIMQAMNKTSWRS